MSDQLQELLQRFSKFVAVGHQVVNLDHVLSIELKIDGSNVFLRDGRIVKVSGEDNIRVISMFRQGVGSNFGLVSENGLVILQSVTSIQIEAELRENVITTYFNNRLLVTNEVIPQLQSILDETTSWRQGEWINWTTAPPVPIENPEELASLHRLKERVRLMLDGQIARLQVLVNR